MSTTEQLAESFARRIAFAVERGIARVDLPVRPPTFDRLVALDGNHNFRDCGGYPAGAGRTMRRGLVYRSDHLADLGDEDLATISALGLRVVHDFRLDSELERQPSRLPTGTGAPTVMRLGTSDIATIDESVIDVIREMMNGTRPLPDASFWQDNYLDMLSAGHRMLVGFIRSVATPEHQPSLHHCTGGKDRTGLSTALLHRLLGMSDDDIIDDFLLTNLYRTPYRVDALREGMAANGINVIDAIPVLGVGRTPIERVLQFWDANSGAEAYALDGGATPSELASLRIGLVE